jgi:hypothetical protein
MPSARRIGVRQPTLIRKAAVATDRSLDTAKEGAPAQSSQLNWRPAMTINADTFERVG